MDTPTMSQFVARMHADGWTEREIAHILNVELAEVRFHVITSQGQPQTILPPQRVQTRQRAPWLVWAILVAIMVAVAFAAQTEARADDGACLDDGVPGMAMPDGSCMTAAEYDDLFSVENLETVPSLNPVGMSVAEVYGLTRDGIRPQDRPRSFGGVSLPTWGEHLHRLHSGRPCL